MRRYNLGPIKPPCTFEGCEDPQYGHGLCSSHNRQRYRGVELKPIRRRAPMKPCAVCDNGTPGHVSSSGEPLCRRHYAIWQRHGDARTITRNDVRALALKTLGEMVLNRDRSECWLDWTSWSCWSGVTSGGGTITVGYPTVGTTRVMHMSMELDGRPKPPAPGNHGLHSCDNKLCLNPDHLRWGTHRENLDDLHGSRNYCKHCAHCNP